MAEIAGLVLGGIPIAILAVDKYAESIPARYRTLAQTGRRQIRTLLDESRV